MATGRVWSRWLVVVGLVALVVVLRLTVFAPQVLPVRVVAVEKGRVEETVTNSRAGTVKARRRAKLAPEIGGRVLELPRRRGVRVKKGELLLRVDDALQKAQLRLSRGRAQDRPRPARPGLPRRRAGRARAGSDARARARGHRLDRPDRQRRQPGAQRRGRLPGGAGHGRAGRLGGGAGPRRSSTRRCCARRSTASWPTPSSRRASGPRPRRRRCRSRRCST